MRKQDEAYQFLNYLMRPDVIALSATTFTTRTVTRLPCRWSVEIRNNPAILSASGCVRQAVYPEVQDPKIDRVLPCVDQGEKR
jgi:putrescine transport system substrate-binding protein